MRNTCTDEELVSLFLETQEKCYFAALYSRCFNTVYNQCLAFVRDTAKAQDMTQDIFIKLLSKLQSYRSESRFSVWLQSVTFNHCVQDFKTCKRRKELLAGWSNLNSDNIYLNPSLTLEGTDFENLNKAIAHLKAQEQLLLFLKYDEGLSIPGIADKLSMTPSAVKMRLMRIRNKIREHI